MGDKLVDVISTLSFIVSKRQCSIELANWLEVELDELFPDDEEIQEFITCLALYQPGGGEYLFDTSEIIEKCKNTIKTLEQKNDVKHNSL